jgi:probable phosphoglycerate mutase
MAKLLLVRHGESEWNAIGRWQGQLNSSLTDLGRRQARMAASAIGAVQAIVSSDLDRAAETAEIIAAELGVGPVVHDPALRERHVGSWEGLTRREIHAGWPGYLRDDPVHGDARPDRDRHPPEGETDLDIVARSLPGLVRAAELAGGGEALVVTHGGLIRSWERHLACRGGGPMFNLSGRWFEVVHDREPPVSAGDRVVLVEDGVRTAPPQP